MNPQSPDQVPFEDQQLVSSPPQIDMYMGIGSSVKATNRWNSHISQNVAVIFMAPVKDVKGSFQKVLFKVHGTSGDI